MQEVNASPRDPATPVTLQRTNSFSTGPEFTFRWDASNTPVIGARYGRFRVQAPEAVQSLGDSDRYSVYAQWLHQISKPSFLSLNLATTRIHFDPPISYSTWTSTGMSRNDFFFRYDFFLPHIRQTVDLGTTQLAQYGGKDYNGRLFRYFGQWARTSESTLRLFLADQISDTYSDMIQDYSLQDFALPTPLSLRSEADATPVTIIGFTTPDVYHNQRAELNYTSRTESFVYGLRGWLRRVDFANLDQNDYREKGGRLSASLLVSADAQAYAFTQYANRTFVSFNEQDTDRDTVLGMIYKLGRTLSLTLELERLARNSDVLAQNYVDRRAMLILGYSTGVLFVPRPRR
jgi:hypothetical protein